MIHHGRHWAATSSRYTWVEQLIYIFCNTVTASPTGGQTVNRRNIKEFFSFPKNEKDEKTGNGDTVYVYRNGRLVSWGGGWWWQWGYGILACSHRGTSCVLTWLWFHGCLVTRTSSTHAPTRTSVCACVCVCMYVGVWVCACYTKQKLHEGWLCRQKYIILSCIRRRRRWRRQRWWWRWCSKRSSSS